jgi:perosamine synthetase
MEKTLKRIDELERSYVTEVLDNAFRSSKGAVFMSRLEASFAARFGSRFAISFVNGTATMHAALEAAEIGAGDEVIVPPLTMSSTSLAVLHANATPVFADVDPETWVIDAAAIERCITPQTRAIITVALYGLSPQMDAIMELARKHNLLVIEDNAEAFLSYFKGRIAGTLGHCGSFSFQSSKHMTCGEGGMIITDDEALAVRIRKAAGLGYTTLGSKKAKITKSEIQHPTFERHDYLGWNYRMSELCCAVALAQLERLDELVAVRLEAARQFTQAVETAGSDLLIPQKVPVTCTSSYWTFVCKLDIDRVPWSEFRERFLANGGHQFYAAWQLTYLEPLFRDGLYGTRSRLITKTYNRGLCPIAEHLQPRLVQLKTNFWNSADATRQAEALHKTLKSYH